MYRRTLLISLIAVLLPAIPATAQPRDPWPIPDIPGYKTLKCDFHMHTVFSDGEVWPAVRLREALLEGLDVIAISDHDDYHPHKQDMKIDLRRPYEIAKEAAAAMGILLVPAVEITKGEFHANALFVSDFNAFTGRNWIDALVEARKQDAFVFWNHPGWKRPPEWFPPVAEAHSAGLIQGMELVNGPTVYEAAHRFLDEKSLTLIANTDIHTPSTFGPRERTITLVFVDRDGLEGVRQALRARRTAGLVKGELWGAESILAPLVQRALKFGGPLCRVKPGSRGGVRLANQSGIPFRLKVADAPDWLSLSVAEVRAEKEAVVTVQLQKTAPAGVQSAEVGVEVLNAHLAPGRNLKVKLPLKLEVVP